MNMGLFTFRRSVAGFLGNCCSIHLSYGATRFSLQDSTVHPESRWRRIQPFLMIVPPRRRVGSATMLVAFLLMLAALIYLAASPRQAKRPDINQIQHTR
jgi:hypothetical protein